MDSFKRNTNYNMYVEAKVPKTKLFPSVMRAFLVGGIICLIGQALFDFWAWVFPEMSEANLTALMLITIIAITQLLTGIGIYDYVGMFGGAGSVIPITGFANSIASPAIEFKKEGIIYGICVKMFTIAGPVIVCGTVGSIVAGLIYLVI